MPTIKQLPVASSVQATDVLPVSQGGTTRGLTVGALLSSTQAAISLVPGRLVGRVSSSAGGPESVTVGAGLSLSGAGVLAPDGAVVALRSALAPVATSGAYADLVGRPVLGQAALRDVGVVAGTVADGGVVAATSAALAAAITIGGAPIIAVQSVALMAAAGASQSDAVPLSSAINVLGTVVAGSGVALPARAHTVVVNRGASPLRVYPPAGGSIEGSGANVAVQVPVGGAATFVTADNINFYAI